MEASIRYRNSMSYLYVITSLAFYYAIIVYAWNKPQYQAALNVVAVIGFAASLCAFGFTVGGLIALLRHPIGH
jgi:hypothetical protein